MSDANWKRFERIVAAAFGTTRRLMKGTNEKADIGDDSFPLCVDCKLRKQWSLQSWIKELWDYADDEGLHLKRPPVLVVRKPPGRTIYAFAPYHWLITGITKLGQNNLFYIETHLDKNRWMVEQWYRDSRKRAGECNKIPLLVLNRPGDRVIAVVELHVLVSVLKASGVIKHEV